MISRWRHQTASIHEELQSPRVMYRTGGSEILLEILNFDIGTVALFWNWLFIDPSISKVGDDFLRDASLRKERALNRFLTRESARGWFQQEDGECGSMCILLWILLFTTVLMSKLRNPRSYISWLQHVYRVWATVADSVSPVLLGGGGYHGFSSLCDEWDS